MSYMTISSQEKHNFSLCSCFHAHPTTPLLKILGGPMHGRSPTSNFWGDRPPSPPRSPPLLSLNSSFTPNLKHCSSTNPIPIYPLSPFLPTRRTCNSIHHPP